jgi:hypothetical protein
VGVGYHQEVAFIIGSPTLIAVFGSTGEVRVKEV